MMGVRPTFHQVTKGAMWAFYEDRRAVWVSPHKENGDDGRKVAENDRVFQEGDDVFKALYGAGRNSSEGGNAHHKATYPHKRAQAVGRIPILLDVHLYFIYDCQVVVLLNRLEGRGPNGSRRRSGRHGAGARIGELYRTRLSRE